MKIDLKYGRLTVISEQYEVGIYKHKYVKVECVCGTIKEVKVSHLKDGRIVSCGCYSREQKLVRSVTHGLAKHPLYAVWCRMLNRCYNKNTPRFYDYGGRGVRVCRQWRHNFLSFYNWAISNGWKQGLHLDKDKRSARNSVLYSPSNCCFITKEENNRYRRNCLTQKQVDRVRLLYSTNNYTMTDIANMYSVAPTTISAIITKTNWAKRYAE